jgi:hypothetical protein
VTDIVIGTRMIVIIIKNVEISAEKTTITIMMIVMNTGIIVTTQKALQQMWKYHD